MHQPSHKRLVCHVLFFLYFILSFLFLIGTYATVQASNKSFSVWQASQSLVSQAVFLAAYHAKYSPAPCPKAVGFIYPRQSPPDFPPIVFGTSLPSSSSSSHARNILQTAMRNRLKLEAPNRKFSQRLGRCCEDPGFLM